MDIKESLVAALALVLLAVVLCTPAACTANRHNQISAAIQAGADPLEAKCAIEGDNSQSTICVLTAARKEPRK